MSRYTLSLYDICQDVMKPSDDLMNPKTRVDIIDNLFFKNKKDLINPNYYETLVNLFTNHYFFREIGSETMEIFDIHLYSTLLENRSKIDMTFKELDKYFYDELTEEDYENQGASNESGNTLTSESNQGTTNNLINSKNSSNTKGSALNASINDNENSGSASTKSTTTNNGESGTRSESDGLVKGALTQDTTITTSTKAANDTNIEIYSPLNFQQKTNFGKQGVGVSLSTTPQGPLTDVKTGKYLSSYQYTEQEPYDTTVSELGTKRTEHQSTAGPRESITETEYIGDPSQSTTNKTTSNTTSSDSGSSDTENTSKNLNKGKTASSSKSEGESRGSFDSTQTQRTSGESNIKGESKKTGDHSSRGHKTIKKISRDGFLAASATTFPLWRIFDPLFMGIY